MIEEVIILKDLVTGPASEMLEGVTKLREGFEKLTEGHLIDGIKDLSTGVGLLVTPILELGKEMGETALEAAEMKEQMLATFSALAGGEEAGKATLDMVNDLSNALPQSRKQIADWTKQFQAMGVTDLSALRFEIQATASAQAILGDEGASAYTELARKIQAAAAAHQGLKVGERQLANLSKLGVHVDEVARRMGVSVTALAQQLKSGTADATKFGDALGETLQEKGKGPLEALSRSLPVLITKMKERISRLFEDINISPLIDAVTEFFGIFDLAEPSGKAMKTGIVATMNAVFKVIGRVVLAARHMALDLVILGLKGYIALKPLVTWFKKLGDGSLASQRRLAGMKAAAGFLAGVILATVTPAIWGIVTALASAAVAVIAATWPVLLVAAALGIVAYAIYDVISAWDDIKEFFALVSEQLSDWAAGAAEAAANFVAGLVDGIKGGIGRAVEAVEQLGGSMRDALKNLLGIHSPSRVMMEMGGHVAGGFAGGIRQGSSRVAQSAAAMGYAANDNVVQAVGAPMPRAAMMGGMQGGRGDTNVTVMPGAIVLNEAAGVKELTEEAVGLIFERVALSQGM